MEHVINQYDQLLKWNTPKRKQTVFGAKLGRLVLTDERLIFLSSGSNDLTIGKIAAGASGLISVATSSSSTSHLDLSALGNDGSLNLPLSDIMDAEVKGKFFKTVSIRFFGDGEKRHATFAPKTGSFMLAAEWVEQITQARSAAV